MKAYGFERSTGAAVRYSNFDFNSFAKLNGKLYACGPNGLYEITGKLDDEEPIDAYLSTPPLKLFENVKTRLSDAYLCVRNDGSLRLTLIANNKDVYHTQLSRVNEYIEECRVKLPKGPKAVYWRFELRNEDGADFDLESLKVYPVALDPRV